MKKLFEIFKKEFKTLFVDPGTLLIMVGGFFLYGLFYTIPFSTHILRDVPIGVIDNDNTSLSREFVRNLDSSEFIKVSKRPIDMNDAKEQFYRNKIRAFVIIPKDFQKDILRGGHSFITSFEDSAYLIIYKQVATGVLTTSATVGTKFEVGAFMKKGLSKKQAMSIKMPFEFIQVPLYNPIGSYQNYIFPLVLILILQQTMLVGTGLLGGTIKEKMRGYKKWQNGKIVELKREKFCEFSDNPAVIVFGKALAYFTLYFVYSLICFLVFPIFVVYKTSYNLLAMFAILIPFLFSIAFLGQALIYFYEERENSMLVLVVTSVPMIFLPGFIWPKESIPLALTVFSKIIPATPAMDGLIKINQMGATFSQVRQDFYLLTVLCVLYFLLACLAVHRAQNTRQ